MFQISSSDAPTIEMPFLRLTVLGPPGSGKTSLINAWVNNFCPTAHVSTEKPELYYRTVRLHCSDTEVLDKIPSFIDREQNDEDEEEDELVTAMVEIEDTPAPRREQDRGGRPRWDLSSIDEFLQMSSFPDNAPVHAAPFGRLSAPLRYYVPDIVENKDGGAQDAEGEMIMLERQPGAPLTWMRMGFIVVFDISDPDSFTCAQQIFKKISCHPQRKPFNGVWLVPNRIDQDPLSPIRNESLAAVDQYIKKRSDNCGCVQKTHKNLNWLQGGVSATEFTRVRKLFRDVLENVLVQRTTENKLLWIEESSDSQQQGDKNHGENNTSGALGWLGGLFGGGG